MSQQALDLRRSAQIVRRHKILVGIVVALGILGWRRLRRARRRRCSRVPRWSPSRNLRLHSQAATTSGTDPYTATQEVIASSLSGAGGRIA